MKISLIGPTYPYKGGIAQHTTELAHQLAYAGHPVVIESWKAQFPSLLYPGQQTINVPEGRLFRGTRRNLSWRRPDAWARVGRRLGQSQDAIVMVVSSPVLVPPYLGIAHWARRGAQRSGTEVRVVALCHNVLPHERHAFDATLMRAILNRVDAVVVHSEEQGALARKISPIAALRIASLPPRLPSRVAASLQDRASYVPTNTLLFFGMVRPYKGLDVLLAALAQLPKDITLTVAGEFWAGLDETRRLIHRLGLGDRVRLRPWYVPETEIAQLFASVDALVLPYRTATGSWNAWLAYEHGVPVIATRVGALADQVRDGVDGVLCMPDDVDDLTKALQRFYVSGEPARLRANVQPVDARPYWQAYLDQLLAAARS